MSNVSTRWLALASSVVALGLTSTSASAHTPRDASVARNIARLSAAANLVIRGKVTDVQYRPSAPDRSGSPGIPYTFVTYSVSEVFQGGAPGGKVTLRFIGGSDGRGGFLEASGVPQFNPGDEDILYILGNGENGCPLVECDFGRFRILNNVVYDGHGSPVTNIAEGKVVTKGSGPAALQTLRYPAPKFDELIKRPEVAAALKSSGMSVSQARARYDAEAPKFIETRTTGGKAGSADSASGADAAGAEASATGLAADAFLSSVRSASVSSGARGVATIRSADPNAALAPPSNVASPPTSLPGATKEVISPGPQIFKK